MTSRYGREHRIALAPLGIYAGDAIALPEVSCHEELVGAGVGLCHQLEPVVADPVDAVEVHLAIEVSGIPGALEAARAVIRDGDVVLIKASRAEGLEAVADALTGGTP